MKNIKMKYRILGMFTIVEVIIVFLLYAGYSTVQTVTTVSDPARRQRAYGIFTAILFVVLAIFLIISITALLRNFRLSFQKLEETAKQLAAGDVNIEQIDMGRNEFGSLMNEFQSVAETMRAQAEVARLVAEGNLTIDVESRSDADALNNALRNMVMKNKSALSGISEAAQQVNTAALEVSSASEALAQGSTEQASAIEQITVSIGDVADKTKKNATEATNAADMFVKAISEMDKGSERMADMMEAMQAINDSSESIGKIIKVIDDIAFQTNILALNAAVEAARAGEAGKGFAVVAEEVRNLAAKSAQAASETAELIEDSIDKVGKGSSIANDTATSIAHIAKLFREAEVTIRGIAEASNYQATAIAQIDQAVEQVSQVVSTNSATSEECAAASIELSNQASKMQELLSVYQLGIKTVVPTKVSAPSFEYRQPKIEIDEVKVEGQEKAVAPVAAPNSVETVGTDRIEIGDIAPTPTFSEREVNFDSHEAEKIISLGDDMGKF